MFDENKEYYSNNYDNRINPIKLFGLIGVASLIVAFIAPIRKPKLFSTPQFDVIPIMLILGIIYFLFEKYSLKLKFDDTRRKLIIEYRRIISGKKLIPIDYSKIDSILVKNKFNSKVKIELSILNSSNEKFNIHEKDDDFDRETIEHIHNHIQKIKSNN